MKLDTTTFTRWTIVGLVLILAVLLAGGAWFYYYEEQEMRQAVEENLRAIVQLKAKQISDWRSEMLHDAAVLSESPFIREDVARFLAEPSEENVRNLRTFLESFTKHYDYAEAILVDPNGRILLSTKAKTGPHAGDVEAIVPALQEGRPVLTELHTEKHYPTPHFSVIAPILVDNEHGKSPLGALILVIDAEKHLYPLIQSWPTPSTTAETLLVRRDGDDVLFLNDLRHKPGTALKFRIPLIHEYATAFMALQGMQGFVEGKDFRGVEVLAFMMPVPDSSWFIVAKMDSAEAFSVWRFRSMIISVLILGFTVLIGMAALLLRQRERKAYFRTLYLAEAALRAEAELHRIILKSIGDGVIVTDARGTIKIMNPTAEILTGWKESEARGRPLEEVFRIVDEQTGEKAEDPVARALREDAIVGLAIHTLLIARNGTRLPITESAAPIRNEGNEIIGVVLVFSDQTDEQRIRIMTEVRLALIEYAATHTRAEVMTRILDEIGALVESPIGFYYLVEKDQKTISLQQWSTGTLTEFCRNEGRGIHYPIEHAGICADCVREKRPIVYNDYASLKHKRGMPEGHAEVVRALVAPVMRKGRVVATLLVGNKPTDYTQTDVETVAFLADLTWTLVEQKIAEERLIESEHKWRNILINTPQIGISLDPQGRIVFANRRFLELTEWKEEEVIGRDWFDLCTPVEIREEMRRYFHDVMIGNDALDFSTHENDIVTRSGERLNVVWSNVLTRDARGAILDVTSLGVEMTERKRAEVERERLLAAIEQAGEIIVITDPAGTIRYVNPAFEHTTGYSREEVIGGNPRLLKSGMQDQAFYKELWETITSGRTWQGRIVNKRKDGKLFTENTTISPVRDASGQIVNYVAVKHDITEQLRLEAQFLQAQKMESVGRLAGGVAHDYNNMLNVILGYTEMALEKVDPSDPIHADLMEIFDAAQRSTAITRQLLAFGRKQTVSPKVLDLNEIINSMLKMLRRLIGEDIDLSWVPERQLWPVRMDPSQIEQILVNLCVNARDAIAGVGKINIETKTVTLDEACCKQHLGSVPGDFVMLSVSDDGCGMDKKTLAHIFEPFFTTKEVHEGTGLGLATVYGIVKQNNGFINAHSEPGKGTTFRIYLPKHVGEAGKKEKQTVVEIPRCSGEKVLLVEDEPAITEITRRMLERLGCHVLTADTPGEAMDLAGKHTGQIHLLITDVVMPDMNGRELAERVTSLHPETKVLFMSGYTADVIADRNVLEEGMQFIQKPFSMNDLGGKIRNILD